MSESYSSKEIVASGQTLTSGYAQGNTNPIVSVIDAINAALLIKYVPGTSESGTGISIAIAEAPGLSGAEFYLKQESPLAAGVRTLAAVELQYAYVTGVPTLGGMISIGLRDLLGPLVTGRVKPFFKERNVSSNYGTLRALLARNQI